MINQNNIDQKVKSLKLVFVAKLVGTVKLEIDMGICRTNYFRRIQYLQQSVTYGFGTGLIFLRKKKINK